MVGGKRILSTHSSFEVLESDQCWISFAAELGMSYLQRGGLDLGKKGGLNGLRGVDCDEADWIVVYNTIASQTELLKDDACLFGTGEMSRGVNRFL